VLVLVDKKGRKHLVDESLEEYHSNYGVLDLREAEPGKVLETHLGHRFYCLKAGVLDYYERLPRAGSIILRKDLGAIVANCAIGSGARVVDAGTGTGATAIFLANIVGTKGKIYTYELREDHLKVARKNFVSAGVEEIVEAKLGDVREGIEEEEVDAVVFDLPDPWLAVGNAYKALKVGGYIAVYNPYIEQIRKAYNAMKEAGFKELRAIELLERELEIKDVGTRHKTRGIGHTAYLVFGRKYSG